MKMHEHKVLKVQRLIFNSIIMFILLKKDC
jgi:hypothetical protein